MIDPRYTHDCDSCVYLGPFTHGVKVYDLYYCEQEGVLRTVICRYGSGRSEYLSGMEFARTGRQPFKEALDRAMDKGLVSPEEETETALEAAERLRREGKQEWMPSSDMIVLFVIPSVAIGFTLFDLFGPMAGEGFSLIGVILACTGIALEHRSRRRERQLRLERAEILGFLRSGFDLVWTVDDVEEAGHILLTMRRKLYGEPLCPQEDSPETSEEVARGDG